MKNALFLKHSFVFTMLTLSSAALYPFAAPAETANAADQDECMLTEGSSKLCPNILWTDGTRQFKGARSERGNAASPIDLPAYPDVPNKESCAYIDNTSPAAKPVSFFVPFNTVLEWHFFVNGHSPYISLTGCARPTTYATIEPDAHCPARSPSNEDVQILTYKPVRPPYYSFQHTAVFSCADGKSLESVTATFSADHASPDQVILPLTAPTFANSGWTLTNTAYAPGGCGTANGTQQKSKPYGSELCINSAPDTVGGPEGGPWTWHCSATGTNGHSVSVSCGTEIADETPKCGSADHTEAETEPAANTLCAQGEASSPSGAAPWTWTCTAANLKGVKTHVNCSTKKPDEDPKCGPANGVATNSEPTEDQLCAEGTPPSVTGKGPWYWTCNSKTKSADCHAPLADEPECGPSTGKKFKTKSLLENSGGLCYAGTSTQVKDQGPLNSPWIWDCKLSGKAAHCWAYQEEVDNTGVECGTGIYAAVEPESKAARCSKGWLHESAGITKIRSASGGYYWAWVCIGGNDKAHYKALMCTTPH